MRRVSRLRNPALARIFREAGIMEQWGTGVQRVFEQIADAGLPEPVIEEVQDRLRVTIHVTSHDPAQAGGRVSKSSEQVEIPGRGRQSAPRGTKSTHQVRTPSQDTKSTSKGTKSRHQVEAPSRGTKSRHQVASMEHQVG